MQVCVPPPGPVPGPAGLEAAEGADQPGARGALRQVALAHVAAAGNRQANLSELQRFLQHPQEVIQHLWMQKCRRSLLLLQTGNNENRGNLFIPLFINYT